MLTCSLLFSCTTKNLPENLPAAPLPAAPVVQPVVANISYAVFRNADFVRYLIGRFVSSLGQQMLVVAIDWELYERTGSALPLAFVGLTQMVPMILFTLPAGHLADTHDRKKIIFNSTLMLSVTTKDLRYRRFCRANQLHLLSWSSSARRKLLCEPSAARSSPDWSRENNLRAPSLSTVACFKFPL